MRVAKWGNRLAVRLPSTVVKALDLKEGDQLEIGIAGRRSFRNLARSKQEKALEKIRRLKRPLPPGFSSTGGGKQMRGDAPFFDTSVLIYGFAKNDRRAGPAEALLAGGGIVSIQNSMSSQQLQCVAG